MLGQTAHRPWSLPTGPWIMTQSWEKLLFAHFPVEPDWIQSRIPAPLELDTFKGQAWISIVPFQMNHIRFRFLPSFPGASLFPELNVRTYVTYEGKKGVYFLHIDADHHFAVWVANKLAYLPYSYAKIDWQEQNERIHFACYRHNQLSFEASYHPISSAEPAKVGSIDHWLMERYCLYTTHNKNLYRCEIHHQPWFIQQAKVKIVHNSIFDFHQLTIKKTNPLFHYAHHIKVWAWPLTKCPK
ncbi:YqjF family protein [Shimazuella kribbensis]|uniref:YqjF family protein n=1 Tax=Shimazuella kribbensis TaxID=139808 RepID=UPI000417F9DB|nr:DUF2071 domain-containing protein [Shimazuella kribbensis]